MSDFSLKIKFYGTRGSIPVCEKGFHEFGGNTSCMQIITPQPNSVAICDAGTGIRKLGLELMTEGMENFKEIFIGFTHFHLDHIQGFPFFAPAYQKGVKIKILTLGKGRNLKNIKSIFSTQMQKEYFPVQLEDMGADFAFLSYGFPTEMFNGTKVTAIRHNHPGGAYSYRLERGGRVVVISTDIEHGEKIDQNIVELAKGADLLIHDAQYTSEELIRYKGWGHSSYDQALQVAEMAEVKLLALTHHDPDHDDDFLKMMEKKCQDRYPDCVLAREGMELAV